MSGLLTPLGIGLTTGLIFAWAVLALALAFRLLDFPDLTVEGSLPMGAAVFAVCVQSEWPVAVAALAGCAAGGLLGLLTGLIHVKLGVNKFLCGIIVVAISYSLSLRVMAGPNIGLLGRGVSLNPFGDAVHGSSMLAGVSFLGGLMALGTTLVLLGLHTRPGVELRAVGANPDFASAIGLRPGIFIPVGLACTNSMAGLGGVLLADHQGFADVSLGQGGLILALAAMTIGERVVPQRWMRRVAYIVLSALVGSVLYQVLIAFAVRLGVAPADLRLATAVLVLLVIAARRGEFGAALEREI